MKNNLHLKSHLDVLFVTYIQINTIWLMNSILKKCKKKFSRYFQVLYWKDFVIQRTPSLYDSHWKRSNRRKWHFSKPDILDIINKYVLRKHWGCGNT